MKCLEIIITGKVQGVFFRKSAKEAAIKLGIKGQARNLPDGSVQIIACGENDNLEKLIQWCHHGSSAARVENVIIKEILNAEYSSFSIAH